MSGDVDSWGERSNGLKSDWTVSIASSSLAPLGADLVVGLGHPLISRDKDQFL